MSSQKLYCTYKNRIYNPPPFLPPSTNKRALPPTILPLRPIQMRIQHSTRTTHNRLHRFGEQSVQVLRRAGVRSPEVTAGGGFGDAGVVGGRGEGDVEFFVGDFGAEAVWVDEEEGFAGGVPAWEGG